MVEASWSSIYRKVGFRDMGPGSAPDNADALPELVRDDSISSIYINGMARKQMAGKAGHHDLPECNAQRFLRSRTTMSMRAIS
jgi:hypothetical protein